MGVAASRGGKKMGRDRDCCRRRAHQQCADVLLIVHMKLVWFCHTNKFNKEENKAMKGYWLSFSDIAVSDSIVYSF